MTKSIKKIYLLIAIFLGINILLCVFIIFFFLKPIKDSSQSFLEAREKLSFLTSQAKDFEKIKNFYTKHKSDFEKIDNAFINPDAPIDFINFLEKNAQDCQLQLKINSLIREQTKEGAMPGLFFQININGLFSNLLRFINRIEKGQYLVEITDFNIQFFRQDDSNADLLNSESQILLTIKAFSK